MDVNNSNNSKPYQPDLFDFKKETIKTQKEVKQKVEKFVPKNSTLKDFSLRDEFEEFCKEKDAQKESVLIGFIDGEKSENGEIFFNHKTLEISNNEAKIKIKINCDKGEKIIFFDIKYEVLVYSDYTDRESEDYPYIEVSNCSAKIGTKEFNVNTLPFSSQTKETVYQKYLKKIFKIIKKEVLEKEKYNKYFKL